MKPYGEYILTIILFALCFSLIQFIAGFFLTITFNLFILFCMVLVLYPLSRIGANVLLKRFSVKPSK
jgi:hypothetical protein